jgi:hypothetical protein
LARFGLALELPLVDHLGDGQLVVSPAQQLQANQHVIDGLGVALKQVGFLRLTETEPLGYLAALGFEVIQAPPGQGVERWRRARGVGVHRRLDDHLRLGQSVQPLRDVVDRARAIEQGNDLRHG